MVKQISHMLIEVKEVWQTENTPLQDELGGIVTIDGKERRFSTNIQRLQEENHYHVVVERTENISGEPILRIHDVIESKKPQQ